MSQLLSPVINNIPINTMTIPSNCINALVLPGKYFSTKSIDPVKFQMFWANITKQIPIGSSTNPVINIISSVYHCWLKKTQ